MDYFLVFFAGLVVGWNFLAQPEWVAKIVENIKSRFKKDDTTPPAV